MTNLKLLKQSNELPTFYVGQYMVLNGMKKKDTQTFDRYKQNIVFLRKSQPFAKRTKYYLKSIALFPNP